MVDNENQWEDDMEYSQAGDDSYNDGYDDSYDDEYSDDDQGYDDEYEYDEDDGSSQKKSGNPLIVILLLFILLGVGGFIVYNKFVAGAQQDNSMMSQQNSSPEVQVAQTNEQQTNDLAESFFNEAGGNSSDMMSVNFNENGDTNVSNGDGTDTSVATVTDASPMENASEGDFFSENNNQNTTEGTVSEDQSNDSIMVVYNKAARLNPFKPPVVDNSQYASDLNNTEFEIIEPPTASVPDENLTRLLQTQISGILYDEESPSAIVNLNGLDQFVKAGDVVAGYTIDSITKDKVQVSYKNNSYVASVGELFTRGVLEKQRAVVNLENKFAGRYKNNN
ncbi:MAG: hypothetical protein IJY61_01485 [Candidatus Gastranaerophilales bacterium]|nr:hypothetical protein [bacterium]MBQ8886359.1 hypothetical protein [Candidatus Gastranaerophilales bacterium]